MSLSTFSEMIKMMRLAERLKRELAGTTMLPLTAEGRRNIPCHPVQEMDTDEIERLMSSSGKGFIETFSEDEACDLIDYLQGSALNQHYEFDVDFPAMHGFDDEGVQGPYKVAYARREDTSTDS